MANPVEQRISDADFRDQRPSSIPPSSEREETSWRLNLVLFLVTVVTVFHAGAAIRDPDSGGLAPLQDLHRGWVFAVPLLAILLAHEFGHYIAARLHRVPASLPFFIPLPFLSMFGTLGAVISMRGRIRSRAALLDIGAAGPLAGMVIALPVLAYGLSISEVLPRSTTGYWQEGQSLLYMALKWLILGPIPHGQDVVLHPTAFAGWVGLFITMINLLPWGQLDGGHIAFALFGPRQHRLQRWFRSCLPLLFLYNLISFTLPIAQGESTLDYGQAIANSMFWLIWFLILAGIARLSGGPEHPPYEPSELSPTRRAIAWLSLALFIVLFMPTPLAAYF